MKKITTLITLILTTILIAGCGSQLNKINLIGADSAKAAALEHAGITATDASFINVDLDENDGTLYYDVEFNANGQEYDYEIDALTGAVLGYQGPANNPPAEENTVAETTAAAETTANTTPDVTPAAPQDLAQENNQNGDLIGEEKAKELALAHAGVAGDQVTFIKSGLDRDDGRRVYDVEFYTTDYREYDYDIDAYTGEILSFDHDAEYYTQADNNSTISADVITEESAKELALAQVPGATKSDIREFEIDYEDGKLVYEGKIYYNHMEYEFEIDGYSGAFRNWDVESIYD